MKGMGYRVPKHSSERTREDDMEKMKVKDLMRPVDEFPRISSQATFMEAVEALETAGKPKFLKSAYRTQERA